MLRHRIAVGCLAAALAIVALFLIDFSSSFVSRCLLSNHHPNGYAKCAKNYEHALRNGLIVSGVDLIGRFGPDIWTALATFAIAGFTLTLWRASTEQGRLIRQSIELGNRDFVATHRPRLILRDAVSLISDPLDSPITVIYTIENVGASACWMTECHLGLDLVEQAGYPIFIMNAEQFPNNVPFIGRIEAGEHKDLTFIDPIKVWDNRHKAPLVGELGLYFAGRITYIDSPGSGIKRRLAFRRKYDTYHQRFRRIGEEDNEHEYAD